MADELMRNPETGEIRRYNPDTNTWDKFTLPGPGARLKDFAQTVPSALTRGVVGVPGTATTMAELVGAANQHQGAPTPSNKDLPPSQTVAPDPNAAPRIQPGAWEKAMLDKVYNTTGLGHYEPQFPENKIAGSILEMLPSAVGTGALGAAGEGANMARALARAATPAARSAAQTAGRTAMNEAFIRPVASAVASGAGSELAGESTDNSGLEGLTPAMRAIGAYAGGLLGPKAITPFRSQAANQQQADILRRYGINVQPGLETGNPTLQRLWQGWTGQPPGISGTNFTAAALRQAGVPNPTAGADLYGVIDPRIDELDTAIRQSANRSGHSFRTPAGAYFNPTVMGTPDEITVARDAMARTRNRTADEEEFLHNLNQGVNARAIRNAIPGSSGQPPGQLAPGPLSNASHDAPGLYGMSRAAGQIANTGPQAESIFDPVSSLGLAAAGLAAPHFGIGNPGMDLGVMGLLAASPAAKVASRVVGLGTHIPGVKPWLANDVLHNNSLSPYIAAQLLAARSAIDTERDLNKPDQDPQSIINQLGQ